VRGPRGASFVCHVVREASHGAGARSAAGPRPPAPRAPRGAARLLQGIRCRGGRGTADLEPCGARRVHRTLFQVRVQLVRRDGRDVSTLYGREGGGDYVDQRVRAHALRVVRAGDVWTA